MSREKPDLQITAVGKSRSGKSFHIRETLRQDVEDGYIDRVFSFDPHVELSKIGSIPVLKFGEIDGYRFVRFESPLELLEHARAIGKMEEKIWEDGGYPLVTAIWIDELHLVEDAQEKRLLREISTQRRHWFLRLYLATIRPRHCAQIALSNSTDIRVFRTTHKEDVKLMRDYGLERQPNDLEVGQYVLLEQ